MVLANGLQAAWIHAGPEVCFNQLTPVLILAKDLFNRLVDSSKIDQLFTTFIDS